MSPSELLIRPLSPVFGAEVHGLDLVDDMEEADGAALLARLHDHCSRPEFQIRHHWEPFDVVLWDNRRVQHFAIWDYWPHERAGHRVTVRGNRPFFDPDGSEPVGSSIRVSPGRLA